MNISIGRIIHYVLNADDAGKINRRRTTGDAIAARLKTRVVGHGQGSSLGGTEPPEVFGWPVGAQAHIGNPVKEGDIFPALVVRVFDHPGYEQAESDPPINLQVFLDGNDVYWATSVHEDSSKEPKSGTWHWPARE